MNALHKWAAAVVAAMILVGCDEMIDAPAPAQAPAEGPSLPAEAPPIPSGPSGRLFLSSEPSGAVVAVTVATRGRAAATATVTTPATLHLAPGEHSLRVSKDGASVTGTAVIEQDVDATAHVTLDKDGDTFPRTSYYRFFYHSFIEGHTYHAHDWVRYGLASGYSPVGGNPPYTLSITGLPPGMVFDDKAVTVSGAPAAEGEFTGSYTIKDADGDEYSIPVAITVVPDRQPYLTGVPGDQTYTVGVPIAPLRLPSVGHGHRDDGHEVTLYWGPFTLDGVPPGLRREHLYVDTHKRTASGELTGETAYFLTGTPQRAGEYQVTYTVADGDGDEASAMFVLTVVQ